MEIELKFRGAAEDVARLRKSRLLAALAETPWRHERLVSTYHDTADRALAGQGLSLRLREEGLCRIQTIKQTGKGGSTLARLEVEQVLGARDAFPATASDERLAALFQPHMARLKSISRTIVDRSATILHFRGATIEAAIDLGRAEGFADEGRVAAGPLAEFELELQHGPAARLFALARLVADEAGGRLRLCAVSKAELAARLLDGAGPVPAEAPLDLGTDDTAADVFAAALSGAARRLADCQAALLDMRAPEGLHQMRVALRRFRAIERLFRKALAAPETEALAVAARDFAARLGPARDWDIFCDVTLPDIAPRAETDFEALVTRAAALRASAWDDAQAAIGDPTFTNFLLDLMEAAHFQNWRRAAAPRLFQPARRFARRALDKRLAAVAARSGVGKNPEARHALRIDIKKLRYAAQAFRALFPESGRRRYFAALSDLQDAFGALNDAAVAGRLASAAAEGQGGAAAHAAGVVSGYRAREAEEAAARLDGAFAAFLALAPFWSKGGASERAANDTA